MQKKAIEVLRELLKPNKSISISGMMSVEEEVLHYLLKTLYCLLNEQLFCSQNIYMEPPDFNGSFKLITIHCFTKSLSNTVEAESIILEKHNPYVQIKTSWDVDFAHYKLTIQGEFYVES